MRLHDWSHFWARFGLISIIAGFVIGIAVWAIWDVDIIARGKLLGNSASEAIRDMLYNTPPGLLILIVSIIAFTLGTLNGHFGWPQSKP